MQLRDYQSRSIDMLYSWIENNKGHPCVVMPTGSGKSHVIAALCKDALQTWPETRILMLTHVKELIEQNAEKMRLHWPGAPLGIYSASVGKRQLGEPITFAGIQSVRDRSKEIGHIDLIVIDECHLVNHKDEGGYRKLIGELTVINPAVRIIGYSATPYRLGHGLITDKPALFDALIEPVSIEELVFKGNLATLRSKLTKAKLDTTGVKKRGGEFIESELQAAVDTKDNNTAVVLEVMALAGDRKAWLFFCTGVKHARHVAEVLREHGVTAECVTGETPKKERERILTEFKAGRIRALTNANVLTTGFDYPDIDLLAMMRPTMSASLYVQMAGRGMRVKSHTDHCLVLDFAGVVGTHGPITAVQPPKKKGEGDGEVPLKVCENCDELVHVSVLVCPACGNPFPVKEGAGKKLQLHHDDIMGLEGKDLEVTSWNWRVHTSKASGNLMLACTYYGSLSDKPITEYLPVRNSGYAGQMALQRLVTMARSSNADLSQGSSLDSLAVQMSNSQPPRTIEYKLDGKFHRILKRTWA
jgi:DNA repair protein RadD